LFASCWNQKETLKLGRFEDLKREETETGPETAGNLPAAGKKSPCSPKKRNAREHGKGRFLSVLAHSRIYASTARKEQLQKTRGGEANGSRASFRLQIFAIWIL